jgi:hypothetical protein
MLPFYANSLNEGSTYTELLYADSQGFVWGLAPVPGRAVPVHFTNAYYLSTDCSGQAYAQGQPARFVLAIHGLAAYAALKDTATTTNVTVQSGYLAGNACTAVNLQPNTPMYAVIDANFTMNLLPPASAPYKAPIHPEFVP